MLITSGLLIILSCTIFIFLSTFYKWAFNYWASRGVIGPKPSFPFGNFSDVIFYRKCLGEMFRDVYLYLKIKKQRHGGIYFFGKPTYIPIDLNIIKCIMQSGYDHFMSRGLYCHEKNDKLSQNLVNMWGSRWNHIRTKITPVFSPSKLRMMFPLIVECGQSLQGYLEQSRKVGPVNMKDILPRFTTDVIGSVAYGIDCNSLRNVNCEYRKVTKQLTTDISKIGTAFQIGPLFLPHSLLDAVRFKAFPSFVERFFFKIILDTIRYRKENNVTRKDFLQILIDLKCDEKNGDGLTLNEIVAQSFIFFLAGFESSASTMTFASYVLATEPNIQEKARQEVNKVLSKHNGKVTYEAIMEMHYLDAFISETLRKYPVVSFLFRKCNENFQVPDTDLVIEKDGIVMIPLLGIHYDPDYFPDPHKFDPERFSAENKSSIPSYAWMPFGEGPRICIGQRFATMLIKVGLTILLRKYRISLNPERNKPLTLSKSGLIINAENDVWVDLEYL